MPRTTNLSDRLSAPLVAIACAIALPLASLAAEPPECDCCMFDEPAALAAGSTVKIAPDDEPGDRMILSGTIYLSDGATPAADTLLYFYHTNNEGRYAKRGDEDRNSFAWWHGRLRGFAKSGADGRYAIDTIRPAPYPEGDEPAHIHAMAMSPAQKGCRHIVDFFFAGDPLLGDRTWDNTRSWHRSLGLSGDPEYPGVALERGADGVWRGERDIVLFPEYDLPSPDVGPALGEEFPALEWLDLESPLDAPTFSAAGEIRTGVAVVGWVRIESGGAHILALEAGRWLLDGPARADRALVLLDGGESARDVEREIASLSWLSRRENPLTGWARLAPPRSGGAPRSPFADAPAGARNALYILKDGRVVDKFTNLVNPFAPTTFNDGLMRDALKRARRQP